MFLRVFETTREPRTPTYCHCYGSYEHFTSAGQFYDSGDALTLVHAGHLAPLFGAASYGKNQAFVPAFRQLINMLDLVFDGVSTVVRWLLGIAGRRAGGEARHGDKESVCLPFPCLFCSLETGVFEAADCAVVSDSGPLW